MRLNADVRIEGQRVVLLPYAKQHVTTCAREACFVLHPLSNVPCAT